MLNKKECNGDQKLYPLQTVPSAGSAAAIGGRKQKDRVKRSLPFFAGGEAFKYLPFSETGFREQWEKSFKYGVSFTYGIRRGHPELPFKADSELKDEALIEEFYDKIIANFDYGGGYYIILAPLCL